MRKRRRRRRSVRQRERMIADRCARPERKNAHAHRQSRRKEEERVSGERRAQEIRRRAEDEVRRTRGAECTRNATEPRATSYLSTRSRSLNARRRRVGNAWSSSASDWNNSSVHVDVKWTLRWRQCGEGMRMGRVRVHVHVPFRARARCRPGRRRRRGACAALCEHRRKGRMHNA